jgi:HAD superfamily hydrolase (TIGR01549 family)
MAIEGIIFDLGHTLMFLDSTWPVVWQRGTADLEAFLEKQGLPIDAKAFTQTFFERRADSFELAKGTLREVTAEDSMCWTFAQFGVPDPRSTLVGGAIDAFFAYEEDKWRAYPGARSLLRELADRGLRLGMYSNATHDPLIQRLVDRLGFRSWLKPALSSAMTRIRKPDPAAFAPILTSWGLGPDSVVVVRDTLAADILGAQRAGMLSVWFPTRQDARQEGESTNQAQDSFPTSPDATIRELSDLPACLREL